MVSNNTIQKESNCRMLSHGGYCPKPLESASSFLSKKWTISIVTTVGNFKNLRFNEIENKVGVTAKTLTERLKELEREKILKRSVFNEIPPRVEYSLTQKGLKLRNALVPLINWAEGQ